MSTNTEAIYDTEINPLMAQIIEICTRHKIAMVADFALQDDDGEPVGCVTALTTAEFNPPQHFKEAVRVLLRQYGECFAFAITTKGGDK